MADGITELSRMTLADLAHAHSCTRLAVYRADQLPLVGNLIFWEGTKGSGTLEQALNGARTWVLASDGESPQRVLAVVVNGGYVTPGELAYNQLEELYPGRFTPEMAAAYNSMGGEAK
ncbi:hypothetical protein HYU15_03395 [Candidatus Woesearchaeota archaeon]|nr:hypothetical protein [Candidatus Woesearchaeota archaeon]